MPYTSFSISIYLHNGDDFRMRFIFTFVYFNGSGYRGGFGVEGIRRKSLIKTHNSGIHVYHSQFFISISYSEHFFIIPYSSGDLMTQRFYTTYGIQFNEWEKWTWHQCKHGAPIWIVNKANENWWIHKNIAASNQFAFHNINTNWQLSQTNRRRRRHKHKKRIESEQIFVSNEKENWIKRANEKKNYSFHKWNWIFFFAPFTIHNLSILFTKWKMEFWNDYIVDGIR